MERDTASTCGFTRPDIPAGLAALRRMITNGNRAPIGDLLDVSLADAGDGWVVFTGTPTRRVYDPIGIVHGGYAATLLDSACGCAVHSRLVAGQSYATLELKVSYLEAITDSTGPMRCEGRAVSMGRRAAFAEATLNDAAGRLYATATSTLLVMEVPTNPASAA
jgi:uncharacterized protein (TIGR00369 family)